MRENHNRKYPSQLIDAIKKATKLAKKIVETKSGQIYCLAAIGIRNDGTIVSSQNGGGCYTTKRHPCVTHAEARLSKKLNTNSIIFVARIKKGNYKTGMAKPCSNCESIMRAKGISRVYFTTENSWSYIDL